MIIIGLDYIDQLRAEPFYAAKAVLNAQGIIFFPENREHRDQKAAGISYEDNYKGNALAAMIRPQRLEIRYHQAFVDKEIATLIRNMAKNEALAFWGSWEITYQGRKIEVGGAD